MNILNCSVNLLSKLDLSQNVNVRHVTCIHNNIQALDVSKNIKLESLATNENPISALDVSANPLLNTVIVHKNNFSATGLNNLFKSLHANPGFVGGKKYMLYLNNPGTATCDPRIYTSKGWPAL
jgi:hypothetical protein